VKIRKKKRQVCIGAMDNEIQLQDRNIIPPVFGSPDFDDNFSTTATVWAAINTVDGRTFFDGVNTETPITHVFFIRFDSTVTSETWILFDLRRFDILKVEDFEERGEFMKLICIDRGLASAAATKI